MCFCFFFFFFFSSRRRHTRCLSDWSSDVCSSDLICADPGVPIFGTKGCSVHAQEVMRALRACGAESERFATGVDGDPPPDLRSLPVHELPSLAGRDLAARERPALGANRSLVAALEGPGRFA